MPRARAKSRRQFKLHVPDPSSGTPVRYAVEWNMDYLRRMVLERARYQKAGRAVWGPVTITVHPEDRKDG